MFHQTYLPNQNGRDFVIGDLHGMYELLMAELESVRFNQTTDRCFSVGDLIDRGPQSEACLELIHSSWFHPVRGNHEDCMLTAVASPSAATTASWLLNGGHWHLRVSTKQMAGYAKLIETLPSIITVHMTSGKRIGVCHAEYPLPYWAPDEIEQNDDLKDRLIWSRQRALEGNTSVVSGIDLIVCGHTIHAEPQTLGNTCFIDTGAFKTQCLTLVELTGL